MPFPGNFLIGVNIPPAGIPAAFTRFLFTILYDWFSFLLYVYVPVNWPVILVG